MEITEILRLVAAVIGFSLVGLSLAYYVISYWYVRRFFTYLKTYSIQNDSAQLQPVSILKTISDISTSVKGRIATFCIQRYSKFEIIICPSKQAHKQVTKELDGFINHCNISIVNPSALADANHGIAQMTAAIASSRHDVVILSDSDIRVGPEYLQRMMGCYNENQSGIVTALYRVVHIHSWQSAFHAMSVQGDLTPFLLLADRFGKLGFFGATMVVSKKRLQEIGELEFIQLFLPIDYQIACNAFHKGVKIAIAPELVDSISDIKNTTDLIRKQALRLINHRIQCPASYSFSALTYGIPLATLNLAINPYTFESLALLALVVIVRHLLFYLSNRNWFKNAELNRYIGLLLFKDFFNFFLWGASFLKDTVTVNKKRYRIHKDGSLAEAKTSR